MTNSPLRACVRAAFPKFTEQFEGRIPTMYLDVRGLVTTGVGNLIDPVEAALSLKWRFPDGGLAPSAQVSAEWHAIKERGLSITHHSPAVQVAIAGLTLHLDEDAIDELVDEQLEANARMAVKYFPKFADMPADAQLGIMSLDWAAGAAFALKFPHFVKDANDGTWQSWADAAIEGVLSTKTPEGVQNNGVIPRNNAQRLCFANASGVVFAGLDPDVLHYPNDAGDGKPLYK